MTKILIVAAFALSALSAFAEYPCQGKYCAFLPVQAPSIESSPADESCPISEMVCTKTPGYHGHLPQVECHCGPHRGYGR